MMTMTFKDWLAERLRERSMSNVDLAQRIGAAPSAVSQWLSGTQFPSAGNVFALARAFTLDAEDVNQIVQDSKAARRSAGQPAPITPSKPSLADEPGFTETIDALQGIADSLGVMVSIPIGDISAGGGAWSDEAFYVPRKWALGRNLVAYRVRGVSMEPDIPDGSVVAVDRDRTAKPGDIVVAWTADGGIVKELAKRGKRLFLKGKTGEVELDNPEQIQGVVVSVMRFL